MNENKYPTENCCIGCGIPGHPEGICSICKAREIMHGVEEEVGKEVEPEWKPDPTDDIPF